MKQIKFIPKEFERKVLTIEDTTTLLKDSGLGIEAGPVSVDLSGTSIPPKSMSMITEALSKMDVKELKINDIIASLPAEAAYRSLELIAETLTNSKKVLESLDISENAIGREGLVKLQPLVLQSAPELRCLNLNNTGFSKEAAELLDKTLGKEELRLEELYCEDNCLMDGIKSLAGIIERSPNLERLTCSALRLDEKGFLVLLASLKKLKRLRELTLADTIINQCTLERLCEELSGRSLLSLNLEMNDFDFEKVLFMRKHAKNAKIDVLNLSACFFDETTKELAQELGALAEAFSVKEFYLNENEIDFEVLISLIIIPSLVFISIKDCYQINLTESLLEKVMKLICKKSKKMTLKFTKEQFEEIEDLERIANESIDSLNLTNICEILISDEQVVLNYNIEESSDFVGKLSI